MGVKDVLSRKEGVIVGDDVLGPCPTVATGPSRLLTDEQLCSNTVKRRTSPCLLSYVDVLAAAEASNTCQNVTSSSTVVAALEAARDKNAPIILQASQGGAAYFAGKVQAPGICLVDVHTDWFVGCQE